MNELELLNSKYQQAMAQLQNVTDVVFRTLAELEAARTRIAELEKPLPGPADSELQN